MTEQQHPITPPPELVEEWVAEIWHEGTPVRVAASDLYITTHAAQWGADAELEACCKWLDAYHALGPSPLVQQLRAVRRPKPPSLAEEALSHFESYAATFETSGGDSDLVRRALKRLHKLESGL